jgi:hypothetical protein
MWIHFLYRTKNYFLSTEFFLNFLFDLLMYAEMFFQHLVSNFNLKIEILDTFNIVIVITFNIIIWFM